MFLFFSVSNIMLNKEHVRSPRLHVYRPIYSPVLKIFTGALPQVAHIHRTLLRLKLNQHVCPGCGATVRNKSFASHLAMFVKARL